MTRLRSTVTSGTSALVLLTSCNLTKAVRTTPGDPGEITVTGPPPVRRHPDAGTEPPGDDGSVPDGGSRPSSGNDGGIFEGGPKTTCGNGILEFGEECDKAEFSMATCEDYGFDTGTLACNPDCTVNTSGCSGTEHCADGRDNDGDGLVDCDDPDCTSTCKNSCSAPVVIASLPTVVMGDTRGLLTSPEPTCATGAGPDQVYQVTVPSDGHLVVTIESGNFIGVSVLSDCSMPTTELACDLMAVSVSVTAGETVFLVFQAFSSGISGPFEAKVAMVQ